MTNPTILLTGGSGFVAGSIIRQATDAATWHVVTRGDKLHSAPHLHWYRADIAAEHAIETLIGYLRPSAVIHTAALADIDYCEANQDEAWLVNAALPERIAKATAEIGARMIFCSTDTVFDGSRGNYTEDDAPNAVNFYAKTKIAAEEAVRAANANSVVARVALVMGLPVLGKGNSFLSRMIASLEAGKDVTVPAVEIRTPIDVLTLGKALTELATHDYCGTLHLSGSEAINRYAMTQRIVARLGHPVERVKANDPTNIPGRAERPRDASMNNQRAQATLSTTFCGLDEAIERVLAFQQGEQ